MIKIEAELKGRQKTCKSFRCYWNDRTLDPNQTGDYVKRGKKKNNR